MVSKPLRLDSVTMTYAGPKGDVHVLSDFSFCVEEGESVGIMGPSGIGKTTLLSIAGLLLRPTAGEVYIFGKSTSDLSNAAAAHLRSRSIGFVFQQYHLVPYLSAWENVRLGLFGSGVSKRAAARVVNESLSLVEMSHRHDHRPKELSGGEQQRIAIARAICARRRILLCDEPTGNLDRGTADNVVSLLSRLLKAGQLSALVVASHDEEAARACHRRVILTQQNAT